MSGSLTRYLTFVTALIVIVNHAAPLFIALTEGAHPAERWRVATTACITARVTLIIFIVFGQCLLGLLGLLGIRFPALRVGVGIVLLFMWIAIPHARRGAISHTSEEFEEAA